MSIKRTDDGFKVTCDACGYNEEFDTYGNIHAFKEMLRETGWHLGRKHRDVCSDCRDEGK
jgi:hypothetical protein